MATLVNELLEAARRYAELGYPVFPCRPGSNKPATENGFKDATTDSRKIHLWWRKMPFANVAIATAGLLVVDVDPHRDGSINSWLYGQPEKLEFLAKAPLSATPRGGAHYFFRKPPSAAWRCTASRLAPNVDTRTDGGYIVVPPSVRPEGVYLWQPDRELTVGRHDLPVPPAWLNAELDRLIESLTRSNCFVLKSRELPLIQKGERNTQLASIAGTMRRRGVSEVELRAALMQINQDRCNPPLPAIEVARIASSISRYPPNGRSGGMSTTSLRSNAQPDNDTPRGSTDPGPIAESLLRVPGFVSEVMDYCLATAPYPNLTMAFGGALALQAFLGGRKVRDPTDNRTNIYLLGLAHSAAGKDHPRKINVRLLHQIGLADCLGDRFASGEGIQDALQANPSMLFQTDEFDGMLQSINRSKDARYENIMGTLLSVFSTSNSIFPVRSKAGRERGRAIDQPSLVIFGTAIPNNYYQALSERMLTNGFFARMLVLESGPRSSGQEPSCLDLPPRLLATAQWWADRHPHGDNLLNPLPAIVEHTPQAKHILIEMREETEAEYARSEQRGDAVGTTVWGRVNEQCRKLALIYAISANHLTPVIDTDAARWAATFVMHQARRMLFRAEAHAAENPFHSLCLRITRILREARGRKMLHSTLLKRMKLDMHTFRNVIATLQEQGVLVATVQQTPGRSGAWYQLIEE